MRGFGASEEIIAQKLGEIEQEQNEVVFEVFKSNTDCIKVFQYCQPQMFAGMTSFVWTGIQAVEILAACRLLLIKRSQWPQILDDVNYMGLAAARLNNKNGRSR